MNGKEIIGPSLRKRRSGLARSRWILSQTEFLIRLADTLNTTLDLKTLLERTASLVRAVIDYRIFAILLFNDRTNDLRMRFQIGHKPEVERMRIRMGQGIVGEVAQSRQPPADQRRQPGQQLHQREPERALRTCRTADREEPHDRRDRYPVRAAQLLQARNTSSCWSSPRRASPEPLRMRASTPASRARRRPCRCSTRSAARSPRSSTRTNSCRRSASWSAASSTIRCCPCGWSMSAIRC